MTTDVAHRGTGPARAATGLLGAAHLGPSLAVTVLACLLGLAQGLEPGRLLLVTGAVLTGQLSVGWSNDLIDLRRDRATGRTDKPLASGLVAPGVVRIACGLAVVACVALSLACGLVAGLVHLGCVAAAWAYNLGLKSTVWSWAPYAVAFGGLTAFMALAGGSLPPWWWPVGGALLGVGAHLLNALPDLDDDAATGVHGLPHRLGPRRVPPVAAGLLLAASVVVLVGASPPALIAAGAAVLVLGLVLIAGSGTGRRPFAAAVALALVDAALLVVAR